MPSYHRPVDQKPPRPIGDERATILGLLQYQRESFARKVSGVDDVGATASPVASGTSLLWLANHMADAERRWVIERFAGTESDPVEAAHVATMEAAVDRYRRTWVVVDAIVAAEPDLAATCEVGDGDGDVDLRWILLHLIEETARHAGHADILRELLDGSTGR
jgi:uncharacterized damage-inducible protein DinB